MDADFDRDLAKYAMPVYTQLSRAAELALYLAGEAYASLGFVDEARQHFGQLQSSAINLHARPLPRRV